MEALLAQLKFKRSAAGEGARGRDVLSWIMDDLCIARKGRAGAALISGEQAEQTGLRLSSGLRDSFRGRLQHFNAKSTVALGRSDSVGDLVCSAGLCGLAGRRRS